MNLSRLSCRAGEGIVPCQSHERCVRRTEFVGPSCRGLCGNFERTRCMGCSSQRIIVVRRALRSRNSVRVGALECRSSLDSTSANCTILGHKFGFHTSRGIGLTFPEERADFCCKAVVESGSPAGTTPDDKADGHDGSVLTGDGSELQNTVQLVECAMLAATAGLAYFLSNLLRLEAYFGCFFPLPVVISSMRWGAAAGRKTMVATAMLLLILSGPLKAASYLLMHGFVGLAMGAFWKWNFNWGLSIVGCTVVRCLGALGFVLLTSWLLRDNILALITMNAHASLSYMLAAVGINLVPTMPMIYVVFASLVSSLSSIQFSEYLGRWRLCCSPQIQQDRCFTSTVFTMLSSNFGL
ncbi:uncharacterized protein [Physcomitrium patens]|uniref:uncharacterized protein isoform X1 n=1 Tax=Physcomitrium patens TaxID=3218 RepID=UPI003CCD190B